MANTKKKGKGRSKSKAALETARRKGQKSASSSGFTPPVGGGGLMSKMRTGFQGAVGNEESNQSSPIQKILFTIVLAAAVFFFARGL